MKHWTEHYFPTGMRAVTLIGYFGLLIAYVIYELSPITIGIALMIALPVVGLKYQLSVIADKKELHDCFQLFSLNLKKKVYSYGSLLHIRIDKESQGYSANTRSRERQVRYNEYSASLVTDTDEVAISSSTEYRSFADKVSEFARDLKLEVTRSF